MKKSLILIPLFALAACMNQSNDTQDIKEKAPSEQTKTNELDFDGKSSTFTIDGESITLVDGVSESSIENSSANVLTHYFGNQAKGDLNGDGLEDQAFFITQTTGGSGTFYYVVVALQNSDGYKTTNAFFVGDRITPQSITMRSDVKELHVNYADRKQGEPMSTPTSEDKVLLLKVSSDGVLEGLMK